MLSTEQSQSLLCNVLGDKKLANAVHNAKLLLVGCGGIGCEVIKNLMLIGFQNVTMIDLDTIDVSNLNRQFLFNKSHINQSKAQVSASVAQSLFAHTNSVKLQPIHGSIQSQEYSVDFFREFTMVVNALDNRQARTHVNRMCLAADVPLIESGSEGYFGQTFVIKKNLSMCYECDGPKQDVRTFASCTIRNTPSLPIHCIVWAKHLFAQLFGEEDADNDVSPDMNDPMLSERAANKENENIDTESKAPSLPSTRKWAQNHDYDPELLFEKLFRADIEYLHTMDKLWKNRTKPRVLKLDDLENNEASCSNACMISVSEDEALKDQRMWSLHECYTVFSQSVFDLKDRMKSESFLVWDKDDEVALNFVTSVSNLRSYCFHIERKSKFDVKSMAGNIIPAISSTNSIVGGLMVLQILNLLRKLESLSSEERSDKKILQTAYESVCKHVYLRQISTVFGNLISPYEIFKPVPSCLVCNTQHIPEIEVTVNFALTTMFEFVEQLLLKRLNFVCPDIQLDGQPIIIWSKEDADEFTEEEAEDYRTNFLTSYSSITNRTRLRVYDLIQNLTMIITLVDEPFNLNENGGSFYKLKIISEAQSPEQSETNRGEKADSESNNEDEDISFIETESKVVAPDESLSTQNDKTIKVNGNSLHKSLKRDHDPANGDRESDEVVLSSDEEPTVAKGNVSREGQEKIDDDDSPIILDDEPIEQQKDNFVVMTSIEDDCEIIDDDGDVKNGKALDDDDDDLQMIDVQEKRKASSPVNLNEDRSKKIRTE